MNILKNKILRTVLVMTAVLSMGVAGCSGEKEESDSVSSMAPQEKGVDYNLAVVVPGVTAGSPIYEQLVSGAQMAVDKNPGSRMKVFELDYNQAQWAEKLTAIVATGEYDAVITSNPSMPYVCLDISEQFPDQKFIFVDAYIEGNPQMVSYLYNQVEQSWMLGHLAALITGSSMDGANEAKKIGIIVAQEYPALTKMMVPGFVGGAESVYPEIEVDYRVLGNWYDAAKAGELADSMIDAGVDVIGVICGGAATGVFDVSRERGKYVVFWDENGYAKAPGVIAGSGALMQEKLVQKVVDEAINGEIKWGTAQKMNAAEGWVAFIEDDPDYRNTVNEEIREQQHLLVEKILNGELKLEIPEL